MKIYPMPAEIKSGCLLYSFAAILEIDPETLIEEIGHDGMDKKWPELKEPYCYQSFHIQELIDCCLRRGYSCTEIQSMPTSLPAPQAYLHLPVHNIGPHFPYDTSRVKYRFIDHLKGKDAVLYGRTDKNVTHAWAWHEGMAHDPRSGHGVCSLADIKIMNAWLILETVPSDYKIRSV